MMRNRYLYIFLFIFIIPTFFSVQDGLAQKNQEVKRALDLIELGNSPAAIAALTKISTADPKNAEAFAALAIAYLSMNNTAEAEKAVATAYDLERKNSLVRNSRGMLFGKQGKIEDALKEFHQAIKYDDKDVSSYLYLSRYYLFIDSLRAAEVTLYQAQGVAPNDVRSYLGLAELYEKQKVNDLAIKQYEDAKKINPTDITVLAKLARLYRRARKYSESANEWIKLTKIDSTYSPAYYEIADLFFVGEQYGNSAVYAEKYHAKEPNDIQGTWLLARALSESNQYAKALPHLEESAKNDSLRPFTELFRARGYFFSKEFAKANGIFAANAARLDPNDLYYWGYSLISSGDTLGGLEKWKTSLVGDTVRSEEAKAKIRTQIIGLYQTIKKYDGAAGMYMEMAQTSSPVENYVNAGQLYNFAGKPKEAADAFSKALEKDPNCIKAYIGLADIGMKDPSKEAEVIANLDKAAGMAKTPEEKELVGGGYARLGQAYYDAKDYNKSVAALQKAEKILPEKSKLLLNVDLFFGVNYIQLKKNDLAEPYFKKVLAMDPNNETAKKMLEYLKSLKEQGTEKGSKKGK
jgi:tetratricopeptide (TPR) repeat protein